MPLAFPSSRRAKGGATSSITSYSTGATIGFGAGVAAAAAFAFAVQKAARLRSGVGASQWKSAVAQDGTVIDFDTLLQHIAERGLEPSLRPEVWPLLLDVYRPDETTEHRTALYGDLSSSYELLLQRCQDLEAACRDVLAPPHTTRRNSSSCHEATAPAPASGDISTGEESSLSTSPWSRPSAASSAPCASNRPPNCDAPSPTQIATTNTITTQYNSNAECVLDAAAADTIAATGVVLAGDPQHAAALGPPAPCCGPSLEPASPGVAAGEDTCDSVVRGHFKGQEQEDDVLQAGPLGLEEEGEEERGEQGGEEKGGEQREPMSTPAPPVPAPSKPSLFAAAAAASIGRISRADLPPSLRPYWEAQQSIALDAIRVDFRKATLPGAAAALTEDNNSSAGGGGGSSLAMSLRGLGFGALGGGGSAAAAASGGTTASRQGPGAGLEGVVETRGGRGSGRGRGSGGGGVSGGGGCAAASVGGGGGGLAMSIRGLKLGGVLRSPAVTTKTASVASAVGTQAAEPIASVDSSVASPPAASGADSGACNQHPPAPAAAAVVAAVRAMAPAAAMAPPCSGGGGSGLSLTFRGLSFGSTGRPGSPVASVRPPAVPLPEGRRPAGATEVVGTAVSTADVALAGAPGSTPPAEQGEVLPPAAVPAAAGGGSINSSSSSRLASWLRERMESYQVNRASRQQQPQEGAMLGPEVDKIKSSPEAPKQDQQGQQQKQQQEGLECAAGEGLGCTDEVVEDMKSELDRPGAAGDSAEGSETLQTSTLFSATSCAPAAAASASSGAAIPVVPAAAAPATPPLLPAAADACPSSSSTMRKGVWGLLDSLGRSSSSAPRPPSSGSSAPGLPNSASAVAAAAAAGAGLRAAPTSPSVCCSSAADIGASSASGTAPAAAACSSLPTAPALHPSPSPSSSSSSSSSCVCMTDCAAVSGAAAVAMPTANSTSAPPPSMPPLSLGSGQQQCSGTSYNRDQVAMAFADPLAEKAAAVVTSAGSPLHSCSEEDLEDMHQEGAQQLGGAEWSCSTQGEGWGTKSDETGGAGKGVGLCSPRPDVPLSFRKQHGRHRPQQSRSCGPDSPACGPDVPCCGGSASGAALSEQPRKRQTQPGLEASPESSLLPPPLPPPLELRPPLPVRASKSSCPLSGPEDSPEPTAESCTSAVGAINSAVPPNAAFATASAGAPSCAGGDRGGVGAFLNRMTSRPAQSADVEGILRNGVATNAGPALLQSIASGAAVVGHTSGLDTAAATADADADTGTGIPLPPAAAGACTGAEARGWLGGFARVHVDQAAHFNGAQRRQVERLVRVLSAYSLQDPGLGYCQGMSDLALPFVLLLADDVTAFWCFVGLMDKVRANFLPRPDGSFERLAALASLLAALDPPLAAHLAILGADNCHFAHRMVAVQMRRELPAELAVRLWEQLWADDLLEARADQREGERLAAARRVACEAQAVELSDLGGGLKRLWSDPGVTGEGEDVPVGWVQGRARGGGGGGCGLLRVGASEAGLAGGVGLLGCMGDEDEGNGEEVLTSTDEDGAAPGSEPVPGASGDEAAATEPATCSEVDPVVGRRMDSDPICCPRDGRPSTFDRGGLGVAPEVTESSDSHAANANAAAANAVDGDATDPKEAAGAVTLQAAAGPDVEAIAVTSSVSAMTSCPHPPKPRSGNGKAAADTDAAATAAGAEGNRPVGFGRELFPFVVAAVVLSQRRRLMDCRELDDVLRLFQALPPLGRSELAEALLRARDFRERVAPRPPEASTAAVAPVAAPSPPPPLPEAALPPAAASRSLSVGTFRQRWGSYTSGPFSPPAAKL